MGSCTTVWRAAIVSGAAMGDDTMGGSAVGPVATGDGGSSVGVAPLSLVTGGANSSAAMGGSVDVALLPPVVVDPGGATVGTGSAGGDVGGRGPDRGGLGAGRGEEVVISSSTLTTGGIEVGDWSRSVVEDEEDKGAEGS